MKKLLYLLSLLFATNCLYAQGSFVVVIKDSISHQPIDYVSISYSKKSFLTNEFGEVVLNYNKLDTLFISYVGYYSKKIVPSFSQQVNIYISKKDIRLNEVNVIGYTSEKLAKLLLSAYQNRAKTNQPFASSIKSYSIKNSNEPVEFINGLYNVNYSGGKLNAIALKSGNVIFPKENFSNNFLSVGITKIYTLTNPYGVGNSLFKNPYKLSLAKILSQYVLKYLVIDANQIMINYIAKSGNLNGYVLVDLKNNNIKEFQDNWKFIHNYPLVSINEKGLITDTMLVSSTTYYDDKLTNQRLKFTFVYNNEPIVTNSLLSYENTNLYAMPVNYLEFNNDYLNILSRPKLDSETKSLIFGANNKGKLNQFFQEGISEDLLIDGFDINNELVEALTDVSFYYIDWQLNWSKLPIAKVSQQVDTKINTFIYADILPINDSQIFVVEPIFDYANSVFNYERNESSGMYISNYMHITKIEADNLLKAIKANSSKGIIDAKSFKELCKLHDNILKKRLFKYKLETNGGTNQEAMQKWNLLIIDELNN